MELRKPEFDSGGYRPEDFARIGGARSEDEDGLGLYPEKHAAPMLRVFTGFLGEDGKARIDGRPWLLYHGFLGGEQGDGTWFEVFYRGVVRYRGEPVVGVFALRVEGEGLESVCRQVARQVATMLKPGSSEDGKRVIRRVTLEPVKVKRGGGDDEEDEE